MSNKQKVIALLNSFNTGDETPLSYINLAKYFQHHLSVGDGLAGFGAVLKNAPAGGFKANVVRAFEDGDFVLRKQSMTFSDLKPDSTSPRISCRKWTGQAYG